jgi:hypothetical protein
MNLLESGNGRAAIIYAQCPVQWPDGPDVGEIAVYLGVLALLLIAAGQEYLLAVIGRVLLAVGHGYDRGDWIEAGDVSGKVVGFGLFCTQVALRRTADRRNGRRLHVQRCDPSTARICTVLPRKRQRMNCLPRQAGTESPLSPES